ncbi:MAG: lysoplasmalogenase [Terriglobales bacterium]
MRRARQLAHCESRRTVYPVAAMKKLVLASATCSAIFLVFVVDPRLPGTRFAPVFKVACVALLSVLAATAHPARKLLAIALAFSAWGDLLLDLRRLGPLGPVQLFLFGLISFLVAHLFYVALFLKARSPSVSTARTVASLAVLIVVIATFGVLRPGLAEMRLPVLAYSAVLTAMAIAAQRSRYGPLVAIGALSFVASDTMLALSIFGHPFAGYRVLVWLTYYAAQVMLATGIVSAAIDNKKVSASIGA